MGPRDSPEERGFSSMNASERELFSRLMTSFQTFAATLEKWPKAVAVTGALGSGKTEWVLNLALGFEAVGEKVTIADLDIINPYFCIRQVTEALGARGFNIIMPPENARWSDMTVVSPKISCALATEEGRLMLDIGGDAEGALALKQFEPDIRRAGYLLILVVNAFRPQTASVRGVRTMLERMESICGLSVGALVSNSHLMDETTPELCADGLETVMEAGADLGLPVLFAGVPPKLFEETVSTVASRNISVPCWPLSRHMMLPWEEGAMWSKAPAAGE